MVKSIAIINNIIGKTISSVIVAENKKSPKKRVFLVFSDDTYFEFYGENFSCTSGVDKGGLDKATQYAHAMSGSTIKIYPKA
jgi:hypothetical protein